MENNSIKDKYSIIKLKNYQVKSWILNKHYAHRIPSISYAFGLYDGTKIRGVCTFGQPPNYNLCIMCGEEYRDKVLELNRLITEDNLEKNALSYFVSQCLKMLPHPSIIVSYSDSKQGHHGYIYQALSFLYTGTSDGTTEWKVYNKTYHNRHIKSLIEKRLGNFDNSLTIADNFLQIDGAEIVSLKEKYRYVYFLGSKSDKKKMKTNLTYDILPYPKGDNENYDINEKKSLFKSIKNRRNE